ncbi:MAG: hypothetical protein ACLR0P_10855 [Oscillospiraceae bacterium]
MLDKETAVGEIMVPHRYWPKDENCQYLNIWSQSLVKRPKNPSQADELQWRRLQRGPSIEQMAYDGETLPRSSRRGCGHAPTTGLNIPAIWTSLPTAKNTRIPATRATPTWLQPPAVGARQHRAPRRRPRERHHFWASPAAAESVSFLMRTPAAERPRSTKGITASGVAADGIMFCDLRRQPPLCGDGHAQRSWAFTADEIEKLETPLL